MLQIAFDADKSKCGTQLSMQRCAQDLYTNKSTREMILLNRTNTVWFVCGKLKEIASASNEEEKECKSQTIEIKFQKKVSGIPKGLAATALRDSIKSKCMFIQRQLIHGFYAKKRSPSSLIWGRGDDEERIAYDQTAAIPFIWSLWLLVGLSISSLKTLSMRKETEKQKKELSDWKVWQNQFFSCRYNWWLLLTQKWHLIETQCTFFRSTWCQNL